jgi:hypothetical protein
MSVLLVVRSVVTNPAERAGFDHWYSTDHMPKAVRLLGALEGWRYWSVDDPAIHYAVYRYATLDALKNRDDAGRRALMAEYEAAWPGVTRTREILRYMDHTVAQGSATVAAP